MARFWAGGDGADSAPPGFAAFAGLLGDDYKDSFVLQGAADGIPGGLFREPRQGGAGHTETAETQLGNQLLGAAGVVEDLRHFLKAEGFQGGCGFRGVMAVGSDID